LIMQDEDKNQTTTSTASEPKTAAPADGATEAPLNPNMK